MEGQSQLLAHAENCAQRGQGRRHGLTSGYRVFVLVVRGRGLIRVMRRGDRLYILQAEIRGRGYPLSHRRTRIRVRAKTSGTCREQGGNSIDPGA
jgi:hypothetical protein